jgi:hypothetical protein
MGLMSPLEEMHWWCEEHSENIDFTLCELPLLVTETADHKVDLPLQMKTRLDQMSQTFQQLANRLHELKTQQVPLQIYADLIDLKVDHLNQLTSLMNNINRLYLSKENRTLFHDMLHHESAEADFAFNRLKKISGY